MGNPVIWFELPAVELERAKAFYEAVFGLRLAVMAMGPRQLAFFPMAEGVPGIGGALVRDEGYAPSRDAGPIVYFSVADIAATLAKVTANNGRTPVPRTDIGQFGAFAHFADSEGNRVGLHTM